MTAQGKRRGKEFEREVADRFREWGYPGATRTPNSGGLAAYPGDLMNVGEWMVECKADQKISVWAALVQARAAAERIGGRWLPVVFMRRSVGAGFPNERCVAMPVEVFDVLIRAYMKGRGE